MHLYFQMTYVEKPQGIHMKAVRANKFCKFKAHKIKTEKSFIFIYTSNESSEN